MLQKSNGKEISRWAASESAGPVPPDAKSRSRVGSSLFIRGWALGTWAHGRPALRPRARGLAGEVPFSSARQSELALRGSGVPVSTLSCRKVPLFGLEAIWRSGQVVGHVRRADFGFAVDKTLAYGYIRDPSGRPVSPAPSSPGPSPGSAPAALPPTLSVLGGGQGREQRGLTAAPPGRVGGSCSPLWKTLAYDALGPGQKAAQGRGYNPLCSLELEAPRVCEWSCVHSSRHTRGHPHVHTHAHRHTRGTWPRDRRGSVFQVGKI